MNQCYDLGKTLFTIISQIDLNLYTPKCVNYITLFNNYVIVSLPKLTNFVSTNFIHSNF